MGALVKLEKRQEFTRKLGRMAVLAWNARKRLVASKNAHSFLGGKVQHIGIEEPIRIGRGSGFIADQVAISAPEGAIQLLDATGDRRRKIDRVIDFHDVFRSLDAAGFEAWG